MLQIVLAVIWGALFVDNLVRVLTHLPAVRRDILLLIAIFLVVGKCIECFLLERANKRMKAKGTHDEAVARG